LEFVEARESFSSGALTTKDFADSSFLTNRSILTKTGVETRLEHAGRRRESGAATTTCRGAGPIPTPRARGRLGETAQLKYACSERTICL
jgi:hypothetical protein